MSVCCSLDSSARSQEFVPGCLFFSSCTIVEENTVVITEHEHRMFAYEEIRSHSNANDLTRSISGHIIARYNQELGCGSVAQE